jgi:hypothetical protein
MNPDHLSRLWCGASVCSKVWRLAWGVLQGGLLLLQPLMYALFESCSIPVWLLCMLSMGDPRQAGTHRHPPAQTRPQSLAALRSGACREREGQRGMHSQSNEVVCNVYSLSQVQSHTCRHWSCTCTSKCLIPCSRLLTWGVALSGHVSSSSSLGSCKHAKNPNANAS